MHRCLSPLDEINEFPFVADCPLDLSSHRSHVWSDSLCSVESALQDIMCRVWDSSFRSIVKQEFCFTRLLSDGAVRIDLCPCRQLFKL